MRSGGGGGNRDAIDWVPRRSLQRHYSPPRERGLSERERVVFSARATALSTNRSIRIRQCRFRLLALDPSRRAIGVVCSCFTPSLYVQPYIAPFPVLLKAPSLLPLMKTQKTFVFPRHVFFLSFFYSLDSATLCLPVRR